MAALTVTATWSGAGAANGGALTVKVITGAAALQNGQTAKSNTVTTPQLAITPNATGGLVYGVAGQFSAATAFTANGSSTFSQNFADSNHTVCYGTLRSTATTTAATPVTLGATAPTETSGLIDIALAEILAAAGQTLAEDASSPAVSNSNGAVTTLTTAPFAPPPGSLIIVQVCPDGNGSTPETTAVSSVPALTFTPLVTTGASTNASLGIWIAQVPYVTVIQAPLSPAAVRPAARSRIIAPPVPAGPSTWAAAGTASGTSSASGALTPALLTGTASSVSAATGAVTMTGPTTWAAAGTAAGASGASGAFTPALLLASATGVSSASGGFTQVITGSAAGVSTAAGFFTSSALPLAPVWPQVFSLPLRLSHSPAADPAGIPVPFPNGIVIWNSGGTAFRFVNTDGLPQVIAFMPVYPWAINGDPIVAAPYVISALSTVWAGAHDVPHYGNRTWIIASSPAVLVTAFEP
jgi:hypothetical protein